MEQLGSFEVFVKIVHCFKGDPLMHWARKHLYESRALLNLGSSILKTRLWFIIQQSWPVIFFLIQAIVEGGEIKHMISNAWINTFNPESRSFVPSLSLI